MAKKKQQLVHVTIPSAVMKHIDVPEGVKRSVKGALHLRPGTMELTAGELKHIQAEHPAIGRRIQVHTPDWDQADEEPEGQQDAKEPEPKGEAKAADRPKAGAARGGTGSKPGE